MKEEQLTRSARGTGLSRKTVQGRGCSTRHMFVPRDGGRELWPQPLHACVGSDISLLLAVFFFSCCHYHQKQITGENQELWFPASAVAQTEKL